MKSETLGITFVFLTLMVTSALFIVPAEASPSSHGTVVISSNPGKATIILNNNPTGYVTPKTLSLTPGLHYIKIQMPGYHDQERVFEVSSNKRDTLHFDLQPKVGSLGVTTDPTRARITLNGVSQGISNTRISRIPEGTHTISLSLDGYIPHSETIQIRDRDTLSIFHTFKPLPTTGSFIIKSNPEGASIYIDDVYQGISPLTLDDMKPGTYIVTLKKEGQLDWSSAFHINKGDAIEIHGQMGLKNSTITVRTSPVDGDIYINSHYLGSGVYQEGHPQGDHLIEVYADGFEVYSEIIQISSQPFIASFNLTPSAPAAIVYAEKTIEQNRRYNPEIAESKLEVARSLLLDGQYVEAYYQAINASIWAADVDGDGIPNELDIWPQTHNSIIYGLVIVLLFSIGVLFLFDWKRCKIHPDLMILDGGKLNDGTRVIKVQSSVDKDNYRVFLCTVYLNSEIIDQFHKPEVKDVNIGFIPYGDHIITAVIDVKQRRYGRVEFKKTYELKN